MRGALLFLGMLQPAFASDYIESVGEEITLGPAGGWVRLFPDKATGDWHFLWAAGGDYLLLPMSSDFQVDDFDRRSIAGRNDLVDHAITACPSGGFLHVASAHNESAYAFRYDDDFNLLVSGTLEEGEPTRRHNDLPILCTPTLDATSFISSNHSGTWLSIITGNATQSELIELPSDVPRTEGGSLRMEPGSDELMVLGRGNGGKTFEVAGLDTNYEVAWKKTISPLSDNSLRPYWPQALMRVKDHYLLAFMGRDESAGWSSDWGNVYLAVLDADFNHLETTQISQYSPPEGAQRPGLARKGNQLLITVDRNVQPQLFEVRLNAEAFGIVDGEDTGVGWDTAAKWDDSGSPGGGEDAGEEGCSCSAQVTDNRRVLWPIVLGGLLVFRRRVRKG